MGQNPTLAGGEKTEHTAPSRTEEGLTSRHIHTIIHVAMDTRCVRHIAYAWIGKGSGGKIKGSLPFPTFLDQENFSQNTYINRPSTTFTQI